MSLPLLLRAVQATRSFATSSSCAPLVLQARQALSLSTTASTTSSATGNGAQDGGRKSSYAAAATLSFAAAAAAAAVASSGASSQQQQRTPFGVIGVAHADAATSSSSAPKAPPAGVAPSAPPADPYARPPAIGRLPSAIVLYQYEVCPFCCKVKAMLDYYKLPYTTVEVNPLTKAELKWSAYRKVPVAVFETDGGSGSGKSGSSGGKSGSGGDASTTTTTVSVDSSAIMSMLAAELEAAGRIPRGQRRGGWLGRGSGGDSGDDEERRWRRWVDERLVRVLTANIYRSWGETWDTFSYITGQSHWNWASQQAVRLGGSLIMWRVGKGMPQKYGIDGDLRAALYAEVDGFVDALAGRPFMGGDAPNLADLAAYGVLRAVAGTPTYNDVVLHTRAGPWIARMALAVGGSAEVGAAAK